VWIADAAAMPLLPFLMKEYDTVSDFAGNYYVWCSSSILSPGGAKTIPELGRSWTI
jgi:hypothetical protein